MPAQERAEGDTRSLSIDLLVTDVASVQEAVDGHRPT